MCNLMNEKKTTEKLTVSRNFLQKLRTRGECLPYIKLGTAVRYRVNDIEAFIK